jgi:hypothetical protein
MTSRERLLVALQGKQPDRVPVSLYMLNPCDENDWRYSDPTYQDVLALAREQSDCFIQAAIENLGPFYTRAHSLPVRSLRQEIVDDRVLRETQADDPEYSPLATSYLIETTIETPQGPLTEVVRRDRAVDTSWQLKYFIESEDDCHRFLSLPYVPPLPDVSRSLALMDKVGDAGVLDVHISDALGVGWNLFGSQTFCVWAIEKTSLILEVLEQLQERVCVVARLVGEQVHDAKFRIAGPELAGVPLIPPRLFDEFVVRFDPELISAIQYSSNYACIHMHGRINDNLEKIAEMGADALEPLESLPAPTADITLADIKRRVGSALCLMGNIQCSDLDLGTPETIDDKVRQAIEEGAPGGGFILIPTDTPYTPLNESMQANLRQFIISGQRHGAY